jgi:hypothetical protein
MKQLAVEVPKGGSVVLRAKGHRLRPGVPGAGSERGKVARRESGLGLSFRGGLVRSPVRVV